MIRMTYGVTAMHQRDRRQHELLQVLPGWSSGGISETAGST